MPLKSLQHPQSRQQPVHGTSPYSPAEESDCVAVFPGDAVPAASRAVAAASALSPDSDPHLEWASYLGCNSYTSGVAVDASGDVWVAGWGHWSFALGVEIQGGFVAKITSGKQLAWICPLGTPWACDVAIDSAGNGWVTGTAHTQGFAAPGGFDTTYGGNRDAFVARVSPSGELLWGSYLGGSDRDDGYAISVDALDNVWVTGTTYSPDFPAPGGFQTVLGGPRDSFVARITPAGTLAWASYLGGAERDEGYGIATDASGNAWVTGYAESSDFPTQGGFRTGQQGDGWDAFVARITPTGTLAWASLLGGTGTDYGYAIATDAFGDAWVTGTTDAPDFPVPGGFMTVLVDQPVIRVQAAFVARITPAGALAWATYLAGDEATSGARDFSTVGKAVAIDASGNAWVAGATDSLTFPTPGGFCTELAYDPYEGPNNQDAFIVKITPQGALSWGSYFGGWWDDSVDGIALDAAGDSWLAGNTASLAIATEGAFQPDNGSDDGCYGLHDIFVAELVRSVPQLSIVRGGLALTAVSRCPYSGTLAATGGTPPCVWSVASGSLPSGLSLDAATGVVSGVPNAAGTYGSVVRVADGAGLSAYVGFSITVTESISITTTSLADGEAGTSYRQPVVAAGGTLPYLWSVSSGALPDGLRLDAAGGVVSGTPRVSGQWDFVVRALDSSSTPAAAVASLSITVVPDMTWLRVDRLVIGPPSSTGYDSFAIQVTFNVPPGADGPHAMTMDIGGWSLTIDGASWRRSAAPTVYTSRQGGIVCRLDWRIEGTGKCVLRLAGLGRTIRDLLPDLPNVRIRLQVAGGFDEETVAVMQPGDRAIRMVSVASPSVSIESLVIRKEPPDAPARFHSA